MRFPLSPSSKPFPYIVAGQQTGLFVKALLNADHPAHSSIPRGVALRASTVSLSPAEFMSVWSETLHLPGRYEEVAMEDFAAAIEDPGLRGEIVDTLGMHDEYGYFGGNDEVEASIGPEQVSQKMLFLLFDVCSRASFGARFRT